jgi:hypothetical protein
MKRYMFAIFVSTVLATLIMLARPALAIGGEWCVPAAVAFAGYAIRRERRKQ